MKTTVALIIKFIVTMVAAWFSFMMFGRVAFWTVVIIALAGTVINYLIGDLLILPRWGNAIAAILDGILGGATAWVILAFSPVTYTFRTSVFIFAIIVAVAEFFFHMYLISAHIVEKRRSDADLFKKDKLNYNTETGSELYPYGRKNDSVTSEYTRNTTNSGYNKSTNQEAKQDVYGGFVKKNNKDSSDR
jgi:hypothetical protein